ncbi:DUF6384 family protein [Candidatus Laterigemmans baculatus]|uniref:DUF6384 family protein n=1 Tax=Candidatus Laterigemmans baculatus TaxID=2770505 RepID=UPI0013D92ED6|nr:DUF6384 family protein [Candidatus Laterigemmans baculatus]
MSPSRPEPSVLETLRVMDVAREVRKSGRPAEHAVADSEFHVELCENLLQTAHRAGDSADATDIDAAIDSYLLNRFVYTDPPWSFSLLVAHLWVRRRGAILLALVLLVSFLFLWLLSFLFAAVG